MTLPESPLTRVTDLTQRLTALLETECRLVRTGRPHEIAGLHEDKILLSEQYAEAMATLRRNPELVARANCQDTATLKAATADFQTTLRRHSILVYAAKSATEGLVRAVADEVTKRTNPVIGYTTDATMRAVGHGHPTSLALNEVV